MIRKLLTLFYIYIILSFMPLYFNNQISESIISKAYAIESLKVNSINFDNSDSIIFLGTSSVEDTSDIKIIKSELSEPDRIFFDIENAILTFPNKTYTVKNSRMQQVRIAQNSTEPNVVRVVIWKSPHYDSKQIKVLKFKNNIIIKLTNEKPIQPYLHQIYRETKESAASYYDKAVVIPEESSAITQTDEIFKKVQKAFNEDDNQLVRPNIEQKQARLKSRFFLDKVKVFNNNFTVEGIGVVNLQKPIVLSEPSRIVYDLPNTIVLQELRDKEFKLADNTTVKIGQFEPSKARIVIKTSMPDNYIPVYSKDLEAITFINKNNIASFQPVSSLTKLTYFKEQKVNDTTDVINIIFSNPIILSIKKEKNKINVVFYNLTEFDVTSFNNVALENKTGFEVKKLGLNKYQMSFPSEVSTLVDCYEALDATHLRFVFTKQKTSQTPEYNKKDSLPDLKLPSDNKLKSQLGDIIKKEDLTETIKDKKPLKRDGWLKRRSDKSDTYIAKQLKNKTIVIDPGHGGNDTGAQRHGVLEKNLTLEIALKVREILREKGLTNIIMTRSTDKTLTLSDRVDIANSNNADIYISIHINSSVKSEINGIETHYYSDSGYYLAKVMHKQLMSNVVANDRGLFKSKFYVINHTEAPAVLLELGFISNEKERNLLMSKQRQTNSAQAIADGIVKYLLEH